MSTNGSGPAPFVQVRGVSKWFGDLQVLAEPRHRFEQLRGDFAVTEHRLVDGDVQYLAEHHGAVAERALVDETALQGDRRLGHARWGDQLGRLGGQSRDEELVD